jgi:hypothetical protein
MYPTRVQIVNVRRVGAVFFVTEIIVNLTGILINHVFAVSGL